MKINESLAKINTAVFYVLSALEYNHHDFYRKKRKWRRNRSEDLFFFLEITIILGEKSERRNQSPLFFRKHQFLEILALGP